jgi:hypothetical protein
MMRGRKVPSADGLAKAEMAGQGSRVLKSRRGRRRELLEKSAGVGRGRGLR